MMTHYQPIAKKFFLLSCFLGSIGMLISGYRYIELHQKAVPYLQTYARAVLDKSVTQIDAEFKTLLELTQSLATDISDGIIPFEKIPEKLHQISHDNPAIFQLGAAFKPYAYDKNTQFFAPYYSNSDNDTLSSKADHEYLKEHWFIAGLQKAQWLNPYIEKTNNSLVVERVVPFYDPSDVAQSKPIGVIFANYDLKTVRKFMSSLDLGKTGYGVIISTEGTLISHPIDSFVKSQKTVDIISKESHNETINELYSQIKSKETDMHEFDDPITGQKSWLAYTTLPSTGWHLIITMAKNEIFEEHIDTYRHTIIWFLLSAIFFIASLIMFFGTVHLHSPKYLWMYSILLSLTCIIGIGILWYLQLTMHTIKPKHSTLITDKTSLYRFLTQFEKSAEASDLRGKHKKPPLPTVHIPTGIYIRAIEFDDTPQVSLLGYIWQRYPLIASQFTPGFIIPSATEFEKVPIHQRKTKTDDLYSWNFHAKVYQDLDYRTFPFDYKHISLQIKSQEIKQRVTLVPDENAYTFINPLSTPGISSKLHVSGWKIEQSYFSYDDDYDAEDELIASYVGEKKVPQLYYNIIIRRDFLDPFIAYIIPLLVALFFLFMTIILISQTVVWDPITLVSAIFFSVIVAHLNLRTKFTGQPIFYLEYFYIITYLMMFGTVIIIFLVTKKHDNPLVAYKQAIIPKVFYWPILFVLCVAITAYTFY